LTTKVKRNYSESGNQFCSIHVTTLNFYLLNQQLQKNDNSL